MPLETATYVDSLVETNPVGGTDEASTADDHLRLIKAAIKRTFPSVTGEVSASHTALNRAGDLTSSAQTQLDSLKTGKLDLSATAVYAQSAGYAAGAGSAAFATSANRAASAVRANSAIYARSAAFAASAANATNAVNATNATVATSADRATSAIRAASAVRANSAVYANSAGSAQDYNGAVSAGQIPNASLGGQGVVEFGTTAEYTTGTDVNRGASLGVLARPRSEASNGYIHLGGGVYLQWGTEATGAPASATMTDRAVTFPVAFTTLYQVTTSLDAGDVAGFDYNCEFYIYNESETGFSARYRKNQVNGSFNIRWMAIGHI